MLQELAARTGATAWAVASMLFFLGAWIFVAVRALRTRAEDLDALARLPLEGDGGAPAELSSGTGPRA